MKSPPSPDQPARVVVVKPSSLGDIVHTLPAVDALARSFPAWNLHWIANTEWTPILDGNPALASVIPFPRRQLRGPLAPVRFASWCRTTLQSLGGPPDLAIDFQGLFRSALIATALRSKCTAGLADAREGARLIQSITATPPSPSHSIARYLALAAALGAHPSTPAAHLPQGTPPSQLPPSPFIVFHPFSRGSGKNLSKALIQNVLTALAPHPVVLVGQPPEPAGSPPSRPAHTHDYCGKTSLLELIWLLRHAFATVSVDSGPLHLAAALGQPTLALHTWSDPRTVGPFYPHTTVWKNGQLIPTRDLVSHPHAFLAAPSTWTPSLPADIRSWLDQIAARS